MPFFNFRTMQEFMLNEIPWDQKQILKMQKQNIVKLAYREYGRKWESHGNKLDSKRYKANVNNASLYKIQRIVYCRYYPISYFSTKEDNIRNLCQMFIKRSRNYPLSLSKTVSMRQRHIFCPASASFSRRLRIYFNRSFPRLY